MSENIFFDLRDLKHCGENVIIGKTVRIRKPELVTIGDNTILDDFIYISGEVEIGGYVHIAASCSLQASKSKISVGDFAGLGSGVRVFAGSSEFVNCSFEGATIPQEFQYGGIFGPVSIGEFVLVGSNSIVLPGTELPKGFCCGALNKLTKKIEYLPWNCLVDQQTGESVRRIGIKKMLAEAKKLTGGDYSQ